jgi:hypothetical protein
MVNSCLQPGVFFYSRPRWYSPYKTWVLVLAPGAGKNAVALFISLGFFLV